MKSRARGALDVLALLTGLVITGCISEGGRAGFDTAEVEDTSSDLAEPDVSEPDTGAPDTVPDTLADTAEDGDGGPNPNACQQDQDCPFQETAECSAVRCIDNRCEVVEDNGAPCDDQNACTENDFCDGGGCSPGFAIDCTSLSPQCWTATDTTCLPESGCQGEPELPGTSCDDGFNEPGGTCNNGWYMPFDQCDGAGRCDDLSYLVPSGIHPLAGEWHTVISTVDNATRFETLRADLAFGQFGNVDASNVASGNLNWKTSFESRSSEGTYCTDVSGAFTLVRGNRAYSGISDPTRSIMLFGSESEAALGIAIRPTGEADALNGLYRVVYTTRHGPRPNTFETWQGTVAFEAGCFLEGSVATTPAIAGTSSLGPAFDGSCFEPDVGTSWFINLNLHDALGDSIEVRWTGAIGANGDIALLTQERDGGLAYGTLLLVRDRDTADRQAMTGAWGFFSQRGGVSTEDQTVSVSTSENGYFELGDSYDSIGGFAHVGGGEDEILTGQWWFTSAAGQYSQRIAIGEDLLHHTGYIAPDDNLIVGWRAKPPESNASEPQALRLPPLEGSLFVALRILPFAELPGVVEPSR